MDAEDEARQQKIHDVLTEVLLETEEISEDQIVTGWVICFEATSLGNSRSSSGHFYGPREMTTWRALGLLEWIRRFSLLPDEEE